MSTPVGTRINEGEEADVAGFPTTSSTEAVLGVGVRPSGPFIRVASNLSGRTVGPSGDIAYASTGTAGEWKTLPTAPLGVGRNSRVSGNRSITKSKVLRRLQGVLLGEDGPDARVLLSHKGESCEYTFPARSLRAAGIKLRNQPFEMDEVEHSDNGTIIFGYTFKPLAASSTAFTDTVELSAELKAKQTSIFRKFGKPQS